MIMKHHSKLERQIIIDNLIDYYKNILSSLPSRYELSDFTGEYDDIEIYNFKMLLEEARMYSKLFNFKKLGEKGFYSYKNLDEIFIKLNPDFTEYGQYPTVLWCNLESILNFNEAEYQKAKDERAQEEIEYGIGLAYRLRDGDIEESDLSDEELRNARSNM